MTKEQAAKNYLFELSLNPNKAGVNLAKLADILEEKGRIAKVPGSAHYVVMPSHNIRPYRDIAKSMYAS